MDSTVDKLTGNWPTAAWADVSVVVAVSGGSDSVALLSMMAELKREDSTSGRLHVGHFNHKTRNKASEADAAFVLQLAERLDLPCHVGTPADDTALFDEQSARNQRLDFLHDLARRVGARYVATGHTRDDQAETIVHRILRGTGLRGLGGIPPMRRLSESVALVHPLLDCSRQELIDYLKSIQQPYRTDSSNQQLRYTRNRIRHELLPALRDQYNPQVIDALIRLGQVAKESSAVVDEIVDRLYDTIVSTDGKDQWSVCRKSAASVQPIVQREILRSGWRSHQWPCQAMGFCEWQLLARMLNEGTPEHANLPGNVDARVTPTQLRLRRHVDSLS